MSMYYEWTDEKFKKSILGSENINEASHNLGYNPNGSLFLMIWSEIDRLGLNTCHWKA